MEHVVGERAMLMQTNPDADGKHRAIRNIALSLTVLSGFSGLVYEVSWEKYLATLLGAHSEASAALLGLFLGGLAIGSALFGRAARRLIEGVKSEDRRPRLLLVYGCVEIGIGVLALAFPWLFRGALWVSSHLPHAAESVAFGFDVLLCGALILPAAILMGGTIPVLTQALSRDTLESTRIHALIYGFNSLGAFAGAIAAGFWLIPSFGLVLTIDSVAAINLFAGSVFVAMGWRRGGIATSTASDDPNPTAIPGRHRFMISALLLGFAMMTVQTVVIRIGALSLGSSQFTFSMVVAVFVLCIAIGSLGVSTLKKIPTSMIVAAPCVVALFLCALDPLLERAPYGAHVLRTLFSSDKGSLVPFQLAAFGSMLALIGLPVLVSGAALPLLFHRLREGAVGLGESAGRLYGWNTTGSLLGALLGGYWLLFWLDLDQVYRLAIVALSVAGALLIATVYPRRRALAIAPMMVALLLVSALPDWRPDYLMSELFRAREARPTTWAGPQKLIESLNRPEYVFHADDPVASIGVGEVRHGERLIARTIVTNGKSDGNTVADYPTMGLLGSVPSLLAESAERAFVVGFGTGVTAAEIASLDENEEVIVAEISPGVIEAMEYFDFANMNASSNPKIRIERRDAYRALVASEGSFDVIVSEPSNPWVAGVEMLFSREFLAAARDRLRPGGVHCQWFHTYETDHATLRLVLDTYAAVFDRFAIWYGRGNDLLIIGFESAEEIDLVRLSRRFGREDFRASFSRSGVGSFPAALAHELIPVGASAVGDGTVHSLLNPRLGYVAARGFFSGSTVRIPFAGFGAFAREGRDRSLWRRYFSTLPIKEAESAYEQFAREVCSNRNIECVPVLADWARLFPDSSHAARTLETLEQSIYTNGGTLDHDRLERYRAAFIQPSSSPLTLAEVRKSVNLFRFHYFHAAAPELDALEKLWARCRGTGDEAVQCSAGLSRAKQMRQFRPANRFVGF